MLQSTPEHPTDFTERVDRMRRLAWRLSWMIGLIVALSVPAGYFVAGYVALQNDLGFKAQLNAERLARYSYAQGATWIYGVEHMTGLIALTVEANARVQQRVFDGQGRRVLAIGNHRPGPVTWQRRPIVVRGVEVGEMAVGASLVPLLASSGLVGVLGLLIGVGAWQAMYRIPGRSLTLSLDALRRAHDETAMYIAETVRAYDQLQIQYQLIEETSEELMRARDHALAADRSKSAFLANMSHELRTPLNAIIGFSDMMKGGMIGDPGDQKYLEYSEDIYNSGQHLLAIINDVLDLAKISAARMELRLEDVDLSSMAANCVRLIDLKAWQAGVRVVAAPLPETLPIVRADPVKLKQIILNLMSNAIKFTPRDGTVTLEVSETPDASVRIAVTDTGIGMTGEDIAVAMQPFQQVDNALSRKREGTGLGLPLALALAELHGGTISIDSTPGEGTTVALALPIHGPPADRLPSAELPTGLPDPRGQPGGGLGWTIGRPGATPDRAAVRHAGANTAITIVADQAAYRSAAG